MKYLLAIIITNFSTFAFAESAVAPQSGSRIKSLIPLLLIFVIFYFFLIRPQSKKLKEHASMVKALKRGDKVLTAGGIEGKITKIAENEDYASVEIAEGVEVRVLRTTIQMITDKKEPKKEEAKKQEKVKK